MYVVKLGGSLLARPTVAGDVRRWLERRPKDSACVLIVGGGRAVDAIRRRWRSGGLSDADAHWAAIDVMDDHTRRLARALNYRAYVRLRELQEVEAGGVAVFPPGRFLREKEPTLPGARLPVGWRATSDSIAARVAEALGADLILIKSAPPPAGALPRDYSALAAGGYVDEHFPRASLALRRVDFQTLD